MRVRRLYLLLLFVFSILITNLHYSDLKPPLVDKSTTKNLIILADNVERGGENLIPLDLSENDHSFVMSDGHKSFIPLLVFVTLVALKVEIKVTRYFKLERIRGLYGIVLWDKKRLMLN